MGKLLLFGFADCSRDFDVAYILRGKLPNSNDLPKIAKYYSLYKFIYHIVGVSVANARKNSINFACVPVGRQPRR